MKRQDVKIIIKADGSFSMEAGEGIKGMNCREATRELEQALGGVQLGSENTAAYYEGDDDGGLGINLSSK